MKNIFFSFCFIFFSTASFSQSKRLPLQLKSDDKPSLHGFSYWQQIKISAKDTSFTTSLHRANPDVFKNLKAGVYTITISSLFNHHVSKEIALNKKTPLTKITGLTSFYSKTSGSIKLSEKIKLNDTLYIIFSATQNESLKEKLAVTKIKNGYNVIQYRGISNEVFQEMQINETTYKSVIKFEAEGKKANSPKAETAPIAEIYTLELNKEITTFIVPGQWNGMSNLKGVLLLVEQK